MSDEKRQQLARTIVSCAGRMTRIIEDLLDFTRARMGGGIPITARWVNVLDISTGVVEEFRVAHPDREFQLTAEGDPSVCWDPGASRRRWPI